MKTADGVGGLLRAARTRLGLTLHDLAHLLGVSIGYVSDVERNVRAFTEERMPEVERALKLSAAERVRFYQLSGVLPKSVTKRLLKTPALWDEDFPALARKISRREPKARRSRWAP